MTKYLNLYFGNQPTALLNASKLRSIVQTSTTTTAIKYNGSVGSDEITITHAADASGVAVQNQLVEALGTVMRAPYTNAAPLVTLDFAISQVANS